MLKLPKSDWKRVKKTWIIATVPNSAGVKYRVKTGSRSRGTDLFSSVERR